MLLSTKMLWNSAFFTPLTCNALILGFFKFMVGSTASLHTDIYHTPLFFSASENSRENIPTSTAPLMQSVKPLPAPPACMSKRISGWVLLYSCAHTCAKGYNANAPDIEIDTVLGDLGSLGSFGMRPWKLMVSSSKAASITR